MPDGIRERDWRLLRDRLPGWQEAHMGRLLEDYARILESDAGASDRFWELDKRMRRDKKSTGVVVYDLRRSNAVSTILRLLDDGVIGLDDLDGFSDETREAVHYVLDVRRRMGEDW